MPGDPEPQLSIIGNLSASAMLGILYYYSEAQCSYCAARLSPCAYGAGHQKGNELTRGVIAVEIDVGRVLV